MVLKELVIESLMDIVDSKFPHGFGELSCQLFDDTSLDDELNSNYLIFNHIADNILRQISIEITSIDPSQSKEKLLNSQNLLKIQVLAQQAIDSINQK